MLEDYATCYWTDITYTLAYKSAISPFAALDSELAPYLSQDIDSAAETSTLVLTFPEDNDLVDLYSPFTVQVTGYLNDLSTLSFTYTVTLEKVYYPVICTYSGYETL
jgi:hypothetical protein